MVMEKGDKNSQRRKEGKNRSKIVTKTSIQKKNTVERMKAPPGRQKGQKNSNKRQTLKKRDKNFEEK